MAYWIGWIATLSFAALTFRIFVRQDYLNVGKLRPLAVTLEFVVFALHANMIYLSLSVPWPQLPPAPQNRIQFYLGAAICALGFLSTLAIMAYLGFSTSVGQKPDGVLTSGPYRWTRNPQLITYGVMILGFVSLYPSPETAAWFILYAAIAYLMVVTEEEHLLNLFGGEYFAYCTSVPRFIINWQSHLPMFKKD